ncbi:MAG: hypothetical protein M3328_00820, partial [Chloroflexota bacterium]|nr:hypothetical protein [Chloroflexota bacterium]
TRERGACDPAAEPEPEPEPVVWLAPGPNLPSQLPARAVRVSVAEARRLLQALLPLPVRRKTAAYRSHRQRRLLALQALGP